MFRNDFIMELYQGITNAFADDFELSDYWTEILKMDDLLDFEGKTIDNDKPDWKWAANKLDVPRNIAKERIMEIISSKKRKEKEQNKVDFDAPESDSDDGNSDHSVSDNENSVIDKFSTFMECIDHIKAENQGEDTVLLIDELIQLPPTLETQFANFQTGGGVTEGALFLHYVLSHYHTSGRRIEPTARLFHDRGVKHTIKDLLYALELGVENRIFFMSRFLEPLKTWSASNSAATMSMLYPNLLAEDSDDDDDDDADDYLYNQEEFKPCSYSYDAFDPFDNAFDDTEAVPDNDILGTSSDDDSGDEEASLSDCDVDVRESKPNSKRSKPDEKGKASKHNEGGAKLALTLQNSLGADITTIGCSGTAISNTKANTFLRVDEDKKAEQIAEIPEAKRSQLFRHACSPTDASVQVQSPFRTSTKPEEWVVKFNKCITTQKDVFFYLKRGKFILHSISFVFRFMLICFCVYFPPFFDRIFLAYANG